MRTYVRTCHQNELSTWPGVNYDGIEDIIVIDVPSFVGLLSLSLESRRKKKSGKSQLVAIETPRNIVTVGTMISKLIRRKLAEKLCEIFLRDSPTPQFKRCVRENRFKNRRETGQSSSSSSGDAKRLRSDFKIVRISILTSNHNNFDQI